MTSSSRHWVAVAYGALDVESSEAFDDELSVLLLPVYPVQTPLGLSGEPAALWRRLVASPLVDSDLTDDERTLVESFATHGIASSDLDHNSRVRSLKAPWMTSPVHELVYALMASVARQEDVEVVFIKGPVLSKQRLRSRSHSGDVDLWVSPGQIPVLTTAMHDWGWESGGDLWAGLSFNHSLTLRFSEWGCEIDAHRHMPGCAVSDSSAFDALQSHTESVEFAAVVAPVPNRTAHAVLAALHALRPTHRSETNIQQVNEAARILKSAGNAVVDFAETIRAIPALAPGLQKAFPDQSFERDYQAPANWLWRAQSTRAAAYRMLLTSLSWHDRVQFVSRLVWPPIAVLRLSDERLGLPPVTPIVARLRRLRRGIRGDGPLQRLQ